MGTRSRLALVLLQVSALVLIYTFWEELQSAREALQLTYEYRSLSSGDRDASVKSVTIFRNGYTTGGVEMELSAELVATKCTQEGNLAAYLSQFVAVEGPFKSDKKTSKETTEYDVPGVVADRVFNGRGELLQRFSDIQSGDALYLVAPGLYFMWPFVASGHRVVVTSSTKEMVVIESISESPRTFRLHHLFSENEADTLIQQTVQRDNESVDAAVQLSTGDAINDKSHTTNDGNSFTNESVVDTVSETAAYVRKRVLEVLSLGEDKDGRGSDDGLELLQYEQKQAYVTGNDHFQVVAAAADGMDVDSSKRDVTRFATVFLHLSDVALGGQTVFPLAEMPAGGLPVEYDNPLNSTRDYEAAGAQLFTPGSWEMEMVRTCSSKLAFYPSRGTAVLFYSHKPNGEWDPMSLHRGCPVIEGTKWIASLSIRNKRLVDPRKCRITFLNPTARPVQLYWSDELMHTLNGNGGKVTFKSFTRHTWIIKDNDRVLLEHVVDAKRGKKQTVIVPPISQEEAAAKPEANVFDKTKLSSHTTDTKVEL
uniref:Prolyl 4-hydroxylase alpha subunit domain-containing protein n=1 Tax=Hyaloperonospora arabidopsidis (strain Emoy2) TaxID=559515 RepID=M4BY24_HYAAE